MRTLPLLALAACAGTPRLDGPLPPTWGGATAYDLASRSNGEIRETLDAMAAARLRVLRAFIGDLEPALGTWNDLALARVDFIVAEAARRGVRVIVVLHDGRRDDAYSREWKGAAFYRDSLARAAFRRRIEHVVARRWSAPEAILAWELQSEPLWFHAPDWLEDMASYARQLDPGRLVCSGGVGRVLEGDMFADLVRDTPSVGLWAYHPTPKEPLDRAASVMTGRCRRKWILCDFGGPRDEPAAQRKSIEAALKAAREHGVPWLFWSLGRDRREKSHDLWPGDFLFDSVIVPAAAERQP